MFERFTERSRQVVVLAQEEARGLKHSYIGTEHILLGLFREEHGVAARVLESSGVTVGRVRHQVVRVVGLGEELSAGQIPFTPRAKNALELALQEALKLRRNYIGTEHILLGLLRVSEGVAVRVLVDCNVDPAKLCEGAVALAGLPSTEMERRSSTDPELEIDPGWLDDLPALLKPLEARIRSDLGRAPNVGDLLLVIACVSDTSASEALHELGIDIDELWDGIERARARKRIDGDALAQRLTEVSSAKEQAIERHRLDDAATLRGQERKLREQVRARQRTRINETYELLCQRLGIPHSPDDP